MSKDAEQPKDAEKKVDDPVVHTATLSEPKAQPGKQSKADKVKLSRKERKARANAEYKAARAKYPSWPAYYHAENIIKPFGSVGSWLWKGTIKPIGTVIIIVVVFRSMLLDWNDVPTGSMEPEIQVGDRIAVNRLAYGLQFPLTGPQIGIPFTPIQFNNPLDGIPQIEWGAGPQRDDIVTFWNPVSDVRMVKRIVAGPGDTLEIRDSVITINGQTATYETLDAITEGLSPVTKFNEQNPRTGMIKKVTKPVAYRRETLGDNAKITQHMKGRWLNYAFIEAPDGTIERVQGKTVTQQVNKRSAVDPSVIFSEKRVISLDQFLKENPALKVLARIDAGKITVAGKDANHNEFAAYMFKRYESGPEANLLAKIGLGVKGHELLIDGEPAFSEQFDQALKARKSQFDETERNALRFSFDGDFSLVRGALSTNFGPYTVPEDSYLMVGDNRNNSSDGRFFGPVKRSEITGKAFAVAFSFEENKMFTIPPDPAWGRFLKDLD